MTPASELPAGGGSGQRLLLHGVLVALVACVLYGQTLGMDFVYDDIVLLKERSPIWSLSVIPRAFTGDVLGQAGMRTPFYRPLTVTSLALDHALWGGRPAGYHATSVALHATASVLVLCFLAAIGAAPATRLGAALLFAVHPLQAEAVSWIVARNDSLCALFLLTTALAYLRYLQSGSRGLLVLALCSFFLALSAKEMAVTLPLLLFLLPGAGEPPWRQRLQRLAWFLLPLGCYLLLRQTALPAAPWGDTPLSWRLFTSVGLLARYLGNFFWPAQLRIFYDLPVQKEFLTAAVLLPALVVSAWGAGTVWLWRRQPLLAYGSAWTLLSLLPVSGVIALLQPSMLADRYFYIPAIGLCLVCAEGARLLAERFGRRLWALAALLCLLLALLTFRQSRAWQDQTAFMQRMVADAPHSEFGHFFRGVLLKEAGRDAEALAAFDQALAINPNLPEAEFNRGLLFCNRGDLPQAAQAFATAVRKGGRSLPLYNNLGVVYAQLGDGERAAEQFRLALGIDPADPVARENLQRLLTGRP